MRIGKRSVIVMTMAFFLVSAACSHLDGPVPESRFAGPDNLFRMLEANVRSQAAFEVIADIDHARLAAEAGSPMPPSRVLIWSYPALEAALVARKPLAAMDLPLRALAYEDPATHRAMVIATPYDYLVRRHSLPDDERTRALYETAITDAMKGIPEGAVAVFPSDTVRDAGLVTLMSRHDFSTTEKRIADAIDAQPGTVRFGVVDFASRSRKYSVALAPMRLILFGAPGPGGRAMKSAPTLGLDAFCQKLLIWQDACGAVHVTFNDLLSMAERQQVSGGVSLRVINARLRMIFSEALEK